MVPYWRARTKDRSGPHDILAPPAAQAVTYRPRLRGALHQYEAALRLPGAKRLAIGGTVARLEVGGLSLAIILLVQQASHSFGFAGAAAAAYLLLAAAMRPVQGRLMDRFDRARTLRLIAVVHCAVIATLAALGAAAAPRWTLLLFAAGTGASLPALSAFIQVSWASAVTTEDLRSTAYALDSVLYELALIAGPLLVSFLISFTAPPVPPLVLCACGLFGTLFTIRAPVGEPARADASGGATSGTLFNGGVARLVLIRALFGFALGAIVVIVPAAAARAGSLAASGPLLASLSIGSLIGGAWYGARRWTWPPARRLIVAAIWFMAAVTLFASGSSLLVKGVALAAAGLAVAPQITTVLQMMRLLAPPARLTEAFAWLSFSEPAGAAAGSWLTWILIESGGPFSAAWMPLLGGAGALLMATLGRGGLPRALRTPL
jgi:predicted MFS family arabinose efflux permease